jgi:hypothetical protein
MTDGPSSPGANEYYSALQQIFALQADVLTRVLPHYGERGRNNELIVRQLLEKTLPKRFSIVPALISNRVGTSRRKPTLQSTLRISWQQTMR